jgi:hypothetical protein
MKGKILLFTLVVLLALGCIEREQVIETTFIELKPEFGSKLHECTYGEYAGGENIYSFYYKIWNDGETPTKINAAVCVLIEDSLRPRCIRLNQAYHNGQTLWGGIIWPSGKLGQKWHVVSPGETRRGLGYIVYYTENINTLLADKIVITRGNTDKCRNLTD